MPRSDRRLRSVQMEFLAGIGTPEPAPFLPDPFQQKAIDCLANERDTLVVAPTGAGKTYIAVEGIRLMLEKRKRSIYTAPLKALSNAKYNEFRNKFASSGSVGLLTGDRKIEGDADVVVATTEIYRNELYRYKENYSLVVLDELHYLADPQRGPVWEESIILSPKSSTLLMLSASISNAQYIADWISDVRGKPVEIVRREKRPVELRLGFLHAVHGVLPVHDSNGGFVTEIGAKDERKRFNRKGPRRGNARPRSKPR